jgi:hypothetical protein
MTPSLSVAILMAATFFESNAVSFAIERRAQMLDRLL